MEKGNGNDDEEPQICTVFSSTPSTQSKTIFDTIAFSAPKKESSSSAAAAAVSVSSSSSSAPAANELSKAIPPTAPTQLSSTSDQDEAVVPSSTMFESLSMSYIGTELPGAPATVQSLTPSVSQDPLGGGPVSTVPTPSNPVIPSEAGMQLLTSEIDALSLNSQNTALSSEVEAEGSPLPTAKTLFSDAPEIPFPVGTGTITEDNNTFQIAAPPPPVVNPEPPPQASAAVSIPPQGSRPVDEFSKATYSATDVIYDAWIPVEETSQALLNIANATEMVLPDKSHMTTPGIIYKEDLVDKVAVNMSRIFGEVEANKRKILTADSVTQDDNGIRELIKLGCYRSAINLTKRILTLYGQGPGKLGQFSKHTPHSLQLWMTRIALLVRIREFKIAESELEPFKDFQKPDMYYEYYQDLYGEGRKGSMVPFHFRLIAAEIPQYASKDHNKSINMLNQLLETVQQITKNIEEGKSEDGSSAELSQERKDTSLQIWRKREIRVYCSLSNAFLLAKNFANTFRCFKTLREKDPCRKAQLTSAIGRLFLQYGDLTTSQKYFKEAAAMRSAETDVDKVENLIDASLYFIAQGVYADAFGLLKEALAIQPDNFMITNNMAVCLLYMGKVKESLALMEATVRNNTPQLLQENVILNLSTIYELENSDGFKKNALLKLISEYKGDGINLASLKMPNLI